MENPSFPVGEGTGEQAGAAGRIQASLCFHTKSLVGAIPVGWLPEAGCKAALVKPIPLPVPAAVQDPPPDSRPIALTQPDTECLEQDSSPPSPQCFPNTVCSTW